MFIHRRTLRGLALSAVAGLLVAGCSSSGTSTQPGATLTSLEVSPAAGASVPLGGELQLTATGRYSDGSAQDLTSVVTWTSSSPDVATVSAAGLVASVAVGTAEISASLGDLSSSASVEIVAVLSLDDISPADATILVGTTLQFSAWGTLADGTSVDLRDAVIWTSGDESIVTVSESGAATGLALGTTTITATHATTGASATTSIWVTDEPHVLSYVSFSRGSVPGGATLSGTVALTSPAEVDTVVTLSVTHPDLVTVPLEVVVPAGAASVGFDVTTAISSANMTHVLLTARDDLHEKEAKLNVRRTK